MATWLAAGPPGMSCSVRASTVCAEVKPWKFWMTPWLTSTSATTNDSGSRMRTVRAGEVDPEVADRRRPPAGEAADQRGHGRHAGGRRHEVLHRQAHHLGEVAHRRLAAVGLPVGVGHEADGGVEREVGDDPGQVGGVQRQRTLQPLEARTRARNETMLNPMQRVRVDRPALLAVRVDAADPVDQPLDRAEEAVARRLLAVAVHLGHVPAERDRGGDEHRDERDELQPARGGHQNLSGNSSAATRNAASSTAMTRPMTLSAVTRSRPAPLLGLSRSPRTRRSRPRT